jgi:hypothetical protein
MCWFNWVGILMLLLGLAINEWVFLTAWYDFNIMWGIGIGSYYAVALGLSMWEGPTRKED